MRKPAVQTKRLVLASIITAALVLGAPAIDAVASLASGDPQTPGAFASVLEGIEVLSLVGDADTAAFLGRVEEAAEASDDLPEAFEREIGLPEGARDVRVSKDGSVVGCVLDAYARDAANTVSAHMLARGFTEVPLSSAGQMQPSGASGGDGAGGASAASGASDAGGGRVQTAEAQASTTANFDGNLLAGATYVKAAGECRWVLVTCTQVGDAASVVFRGVVS